MSDMKNFDDFIHSGLNKHSSEVPSHIWDNIVAERNKRKPTGFWLGFLNYRNVALLAGLLLASGTGIAILSNPTNMANTNKFSSSLTTLNSNTSKTISSNNTTTKGFNKTRSSDQVDYTAAASSYRSASESNNKESLQHSTSDNVIKNSSATASPSNTMNSDLSSNSNTTTTNTHRQKRYFIAGIENIGVIQANTADVQSDKLATDNSSNSNDDVNTNNSSSATDHTTRKHRTARGLTDGYMSETDMGAMADNDQTTNNSQFLPQSFLVTRLQDSAQKIGMPEMAINNLAKLNLPECPTVEKNTAGNKQYVEAYISPDYGIRTLSDSSKNNSAYLQQRKQSTSFSSAFSIGARYTKVLKSGISLAAGLNYSQINEKFTIVENNISVTEIRYDNRGNIVGTDTIKETQYKTSHNHYHSVDVPLLLGYEMGNDKIHININAGPVMNIYSWQHGQVLSQDSMPESISSGKSASLAYQYKTNVGLGVTGGVSVFYKLNDQLHVFAEPYFRYNFGSMTNGNSPIQQKYTTVGMHIGLRLDL
ncbi:MAG TPA: outer membrane beta-barrel protein [Ferruginibacter sp.]|nr:outer membrane beta-barrel protein [Ferruginibacter sp.]